MLDTYGRKYVNPLINLGAKGFLKVKLKPNEVTFLALIVGILTGVFIYLNKPIIAVVTLWISGYLDSVDGAMARESKKTSPLGTLMDITFDRIVELTVILVLALRFTESRMNLLILTMVILISMTIFLTVGALAENNGIKSFKYQAGLAERSEGFILLSLMIIFENTYLNLFINLFILIIGITIIQRAIEAKKILK